MPEISVEQQKLIIQEATTAALKAASTAKATQSPEQLIASLNSRLPVFRYDSSRDDTFESYYSRYSTIITEDGRDLTDTQKVRLLVVKLDTAEYNQFADSVKPKTPYEQEYAPTVELLQKLFAPVRTLVMKRYDFFSLTRRAGMDVLEFSTRLNAACERAAPPMDADQLKCLRSRRRDAQVPRSEGQLSTTRAVKHGVFLQHVFEGRKQPPSEELQQAKSWPITIKGTSSNKPDRPCKGCGGPHWRSDCPHKDSKCNKCGTVGHIKKVPSTNRSQLQTKKNKPKELRARFANSDADVNFVKSKNPKVQADAPADCSAPINLDLSLNGQKVRFILDTGADSTLLSMEAYKKLGRPWIEALHLYEWMASLKSSATFTVNASPDGNSKSSPTAKPNPTSIPPKISSAAELKDALQQRFPSVFSAALGQCNKLKAQLHLKKDAQPVFCRKRPFPNGALPVVDAELDRLEQIGAISRVDYSEWVAPIVVVTKKNDAYLQIELDDESKKLCGITTHRGIPHAGCYLDDVIVGGPTLEAHINALFQEIHFLGRIVDANGIRPNPDRVKAFKDMPAPHDVHTVKSFLGSLNYYGRFLPQIREVRAPLDQLTQKDTDASSHGLGATTSYRFPDGKIMTIEHASRSLNPAERNYGQIEKEGLALILATDHKPLLTIFGSTKGIPTYTANRLQRWSLTLLAYDFDIKHVKRADFGQADVLSRLMDKQRSNNGDEEVVIAAFFHEDQKADDAFVHILQSGIDSSYPVTSDQIVDETDKDELLQQVVRRSSAATSTSCVPVRLQIRSTPFPALQFLHLTRLLHDFRALLTALLRPVHIRHRARLHVHLQAHLQLRRLARHLVVRLRQLHSRLLAATRFATAPSSTTVPS